jgi:hypothetical protein
MPGHHRGLGACRAVTARVSPGHSGPAGREQRCLTRADQRRIEWSHEIPDSGISHRNAGSGPCSGTESGDLSPDFAALEHAAGDFTALGKDPLHGGSSPRTPSGLHVSVGPFSRLGLTFRPCLRGAAGVLEALAGEPIMAGQGERLQTFGGNGVMWLCPGPTVQPRGRAGAWLRSSLRGSRGCRPRGHGAVRGGQRDQSEARPRRPGAGARPAGDHALPVPGPAHPASCARLRATRDLTCPSHSA